ncbi:MAG TPA: alpha/beta hydrolase [Anaerolineae bacterium]|nr:alpha/beta hydrolase [Anaerolineae bacterium]HQH38958.1 alpha/beta hydrolase [Anaerolineae bacterium]
MSSIVTDRGIVHYETFGRGKPVVLLHCWLGSWSYWYSTMEYLADRQYKTYALDFWGFGESAKQGSFSVSEYVRMVDQFMERMGLEHARVMGHSMGGTVSLSLALTHPQRVSKIAVVGSPVTGSGLAFLLKLSGYREFARLLYAIPGLLTLSMKLLSLSYARDWRTLYSMLKKDLSRTTWESFSASIRDLRLTDLRPQLNELHVPTMGIYGRKDNIVDPKQGELLRQGVKTHVIHYFEHSGHFPMLDERDHFHTTILEFLVDS